MSDRFAAARQGARAPRQLHLAEINALVGAEVLGASGFEYIDGVTTSDAPLPHRVLFVERYSDALLARLESTGGASALVVATPEFARLTCPRLLTPHPRMLFARLVTELFSYLGETSVQTVPIHPSAQVHPAARLSIGVTVAARSIVGEGCYLFPNVTIGPDVRMGRDCIVKSGTVIGQPGFGVYHDAEGRPRHLPHVGGVILGDHIVIGALNTVAGGTIHPTVVEDYVETDDHVHIAHNCRVGARTLITACAELSGSVTIGPDCWIGPNTSIRNSATIGANAFVGIGSNVVASVPDGGVVYGNPAKPKVNGDPSSG
jgi:UDP-3-O-[3-hydroxymyristoyl] glucosamine N-acyltransferase